MCCQIHYIMENQHNLTCRNPHTIMFQVASEVSGKSLHHGQQYWSLHHGQQYWKSSSKHYFKREHLCSTKALLTTKYELILSMRVQLNWHSQSRYLLPLPSQLSLVNIHQCCSKDCLTKIWSSTLETLKFHFIIIGLGSLFMTTSSCWCMCKIVVILVQCTLNILLSFYSQEKTPHSSPVRAGYEMYFVSSEYDQWSNFVMDTGITLSMRPAIGWAHAHNDHCGYSGCMHHAILAYGISWKLCNESMIYCI